MGGVLFSLWHQLPELRQLPHIILGAEGGWGSGVLLWTARHPVVSFGEEQCAGCFIGGMGGSQIMSPIFSLNYYYCCRYGYCFRRRMLLNLN